MNRHRVSFRHLQRLTDDTGILEHSLGKIPRRREGYSTDDQARALWACLEWMNFVQEEERDELTGLADTYLSFLLWVQKDDGHFHNNIAYDRTRERETPSDDCLGRCLWAGALCLIRLEDEDRRLAAHDMFVKAMERIPDLRHPRGWSFALAALSLLIQRRYPLQLEPLAEWTAARLMESYRAHGKPDWHWFEPVVTYSGAVIPWGLLCGYEAFRRQEWLAAARESLDFLIRLSTNGKGQIRPIGNRGWCSPGHRPQWDQQPVDVMKLALACAKAYEITGNALYADVVGKCRGWFYGENDAGALLADPEDGSCCDGLGEHGPNLNQGAESTIAYLLTEAIARQMSGGANDEADSHIVCAGKS